ncbi:MAG: hypothetical protein AABX01_04175 [Candidatus Micrarchaeota archaeon]|mgnify:CR=1 FL=1
MGDFLDSQTTVILALAMVIIIWFMSYPKRSKPKQPDEYRF